MSELERAVHIERGCLREEILRKKTGGQSKRKALKETMDDYLPRNLSRMTREAEQREKRLRDDMEQPGVNKSNKSSPSRYEPRSRRGGVCELNCTTMAEKN